MDLTEVRKKKWQIGEFLLDPSSHELISESSTSMITTKMLDVLLTLLVKRGDVVTRDEIYEMVWGDIQVSEQLVARAISDLRKALSDDAKSSHYIETLPKSGYRLIADVKEVNRSSKINVNPISSKYLLAFMIVVSIIIVSVFIFQLNKQSTNQITNQSNKQSNNSPEKILKTPIKTSTETQLTSRSGVETAPMLSPDGKQLIYSYRASALDFWQVYIKDLSTGTQQKLNTIKADQFAPRFSRDGKKVIFTQYQDKNNSSTCSLIIYTIITDAYKKLDASCSARFPMSSDWDIDAKWVIYTHDIDKQKRGLVAVNVENGVIKTLTVPPRQGMTDYSPRVSTDGDKLIFVRGQLKPNHRSSLMTMALTLDENTSRNETIQLTNKDINIYGLSWKNNNQILYINNSGDINGLRLYDLTDNSDLFLKSIGMHRIDYHKASSSLLFARKSQVSDIYRINLNDSAEQLAETVISSTKHDTQPRLSPDSKYLAFITDRAGHEQVWISDNLGKNQHKLSSFPDLKISDISWSPDSKSLLISLRTAGKNYLYKIQVNNSKVVLLDTAHVEINDARWSNQQDWLIASCKVKEDWYVCRLPSVGGDFELLNDAIGVSPYVPIDSDYIYFSRERDGLWRIPSNGGKSEVVWRDFPEHSWKNFALFEQDLFYIKQHSQSQNIEIVRRDLISNQETVIFKTNLYLLNTSINITSDGQHLYLSSSQRSNDDLFKIDIL